LKAFKDQDGLVGFLNALKEKPTLLKSIKELKGLSSTLVNTLDGLVGEVNGGAVDEKKKTKKKK
jgi:hypothetical protein